MSRTHRDRYAELLRHFLAGNLTNFEYETGCDAILRDCTSTKEREAIEGVYWAAWHLYDDINTHRMRGKWALTRESRQMVARWIMFLYGGREYEWPRRTISNCLLT